MGPHTQGPCENERRRVSARRRRHLTVSVLLLLVLVVSALAFGKPGSGVRVRRPAGELCVGESFRVGVRYRPKVGGKRWYRLRVWDPDERRIVARRGRARRRWRHWWLPVTKEGTYRILYRWRGKRRVFFVEARDCSPPATGLFLNLPEGGVLFNLENMSPGDTEEGCVTVGYDDGPPLSVRLFGETAGTGLADHLLLRVERGGIEEATTSATCGGFAPDTADHSGLGPGVLYEGTLAGWPGDWDAGVVDPDVWSPGDSHAYRLVVTLPEGAGNQVQGLTALQTFIWQGQE